MDTGDGGIQDPGIDIPDGLVPGTPAINCTTDSLPNGISSGSIYSPELTPDLIGLCDGWVLLADHIGNQLAFLNPVSHLTAPPIQLDSSPGRLAYDAEHSLVYASLSPETKIAKVDLRSGAVHYIEGADVTMLAIGNGGQVLGVTPVAGGTPKLRVFDGTTETMVATIDLMMSQDGSLIVFDRQRNLIVTAATGETSATPWYSSLNRFMFDPQALSVAFEESLPNVGINGRDLVISDDGMHVVFPCGEGNDTHYSLFDFPTDDFRSTMRAWPVGAYPYSAAFSPDGKYLAATNASELQIWDATTPVKLTKAPGCRYVTQPARVAFSRGGKVAFWLASGCYKLSSGNVGVLTFATIP